MELHLAGWLELAGWLAGRRLLSQPAHPQPKTPQTLVLLVLLFFLVSSMVFWSFWSYVWLAGWSWLAGWLAGRRLLSQHLVRTYTLPYIYSIYYIRITNTI